MKNTLNAAYNTQHESRSKDGNLSSPWAPQSHREHMLTQNIDLPAAIGAEVGALNHPIIPPERGLMTFIDYAPTHVLKDRHRNFPERVSGMVEVDYVWSGSGSLAEIVGDAIRFDFVIACHVVEHVPNLLGWFRGLHEVLFPGGILNLAVPDARFTFDVACPVSTLGMAVEADLARYSFPSVRQMFDHCYYAKNIEPGEIWLRHHAPSERPPFTGDIAPKLALCQAHEILKTNCYVDSHCWIFTPLSFLSLLEGAAGLGLFPFLPVNLTPTRVGDFEFYASFQRADESIPPNELETRQSALFSTLRSRLEEEQRYSALLASAPFPPLEARILPRHL
jgi:hypothetical protein